MQRPKSNGNDGVRRLRHVDLTRIKCGTCSSSPAIASYSPRSWMIKTGAKKNLEWVKKKSATREYSELERVVLVKTNKKGRKKRILHAGPSGISLAKKLTNLHGDNFNSTPCRFSFHTLLLHSSSFRSARRVQCHLPQKYLMTFLSLTSPPYFLPPSYKILKTFSLSYGLTRERERERKISILITLLTYFNKIRRDPFSFFHRSLFPSILRVHSKQAWLKISHYFQLVVRLLLLENIPQSLFVSWTLFSPTVFSRSDLTLSFVGPFHLRLRYIRESRGRPRNRGASDEQPGPGVRQHLFA